MLGLSHTDGTGGGTCDTARERAATSRRKHLQHGAYSHTATQAGLEELHLNNQLQLLLDRPIGLQEIEAPRISR